MTMTLKQLNLSLYTIAFLLMNSCSMPECKNSNPVFDSFSPDANEYKNELAKQIRNIGSENLSYWHNTYVKKNSTEYIVVNIQGQELCAVGEIEVSDWQKISGMRTENSGYTGAK